MLASRPIDRLSRPQLHNVSHQGLMILMLLVLIASLVPPYLQNRVGVTGIAEPAVPAGPLPATPAAPAFALPGELSGKSEVVELRTANTRTYAMGDGSFGMLQDIKPMHFLDKDGAWQAINPAFEAVPTGWINTANSLQTGVSQRSSSAKLGSAEVAVGWEPAELVLSAPDRSTTLALPEVSTGALAGVRSNNGTTIRYRKSWNLPGVVDQWHIEPGSSEYSLLLPALPAVDMGTPASLDLRVLLHLFPGTTIQVGGKSAVLPLETSEGIEFVGADGSVLQLQSPQTYEQQRPDVALPGSYALQGTADATVVELRVRTDWSWLAAPGRQFPVIVDPLFQMRASTTMAVAEYNPADPHPFLGSVQTVHGMLGRANRIDRMMVRFDLPRMPVGTQVSKAYLLATPTDVVNGTTVGGQNTFDFEHIGLSNYVSLYPLTNNAIDSASTAPAFGPAIGAPQVMTYSTGEEQHQGTRWDITTQAQAWLPTQAFVENNGLLLSNDNELCAPTVLGHQIGSCGYFVFDEKPSNWAADDLDTTQRSLDPNDPATPATAQGGLRILVFYSGPTLLENQPVSVSQQGGGALPQGQDPYYHADHVFGIPPLPTNRWQAAVVRSFGAATGLNPPTSANPTYRRGLQGSVPLSLRSDDDGLEYTSLQPSNNTVAYMLLDGRGQVSDPNRKYKLHLKPTTLNPEAEEYDVRLMSETGSFQPNNGAVTKNYTFDSKDPLALWNLQLTPGSNNRIDIEVSGDSTKDQVYLDNARFFSPQVFHGAGQLDFKLSENGGPVGKLVTDGQVHPHDAGIAPSMSFHGSIFTAQAGQYALALAYNGPEIAGMAIPPCSKEFCNDPPQVIPVRYGMTVTVTSCANGAFPTSKGACQVVACPTLNAFPINSNPNKYREAGGFGLWNQDGWDAAGTQANSLHPANAAAPMIGGPNRAAATIAVIGGTVSYNGSNVSLSTDSTILLVNCQAPTSNVPKFTKSFDVFDGGMVRKLVGNTSIPAFGPVAGSAPPVADPWPSADRLSGDLLNLSFSVFPIVGNAEGRADLRRQLSKPDGTLVSPKFGAQWSFTALGWSSLQSSVGPEPRNPLPPTLASLQPRTGTVMSFDTLPAVDASSPEIIRTFTALRGSAGTISQPAGLGGASRPIQVIILPRDKPVPSDPAIFCAASCLDLRPLTDTPFLVKPDRVWEAPDVHTNSKAGTVMLKQAGEMEVWSNDHPNSIPQEEPSVTKEYSFDAFKGSVTVALEPCSAGGPAVVVIKGETRIALPNIGDTQDNPGANISAKYKICETKLRGVKLSFSSPIGLPLGTSGIFLTGLSGEVNIEADYTVIAFGIDWQTSATGGDKTVKGTGQITIDTRGLVDIQATAKLLGVVDAKGELWVAWNPLDVGFQVSVSYKDWLTGQLRAHMWAGQGWQHKYNWLPDNNDDIHIAAEISAKLSIKKGAIVSWAIIDLPPFDITFSITIAFGQFCTNPKCTSYEWGIKGVLEVMDYDIGLYYGFDEGFDFILGTDDHLLIDQYGGTTVGPLALQIAGRDTDIQAAPQAFAGTTLIPLTVNASSEQLMFMLGWQAGGPHLSLIDPTGTEIDVGNAAAHGTQISSTGLMTMITVQSPLAGQWKAKISNLAASGVEHYKFMYFASKGLPGTAQSRATITTPANANENGLGTYTITWKVPPTAPAKSTIALFYTREEGVDAQPASTNLEQDVPIVRNLPFTAGTYPWDTTMLASGTYHIRAEVDDGVNTFDGRISDSDNTCLPQTSTLPGQRAFDPDRFAGVEVITATGTIRIADTVAPASVSGVQVTPVDSALLVKWAPVVDRDTTNYLVRWGIRTGSSFSATNQQLLTAVELPTLRIGAVDNGKEYSVDVSAIDASGNQGVASPPIFATPGGASTPVPLMPTNVVLTSKTTTSVSLSWTPGAGPAASGYRLFFRHLGLDDQVEQQDTSVASATIKNLAAGGTYTVMVSALSAEGWTSVASDRIQVVLTNGIDANSDGVPDDWAKAYGVGGATLDDDNDGLSNGAEFTAGTDPSEQDSDGDTFSDKEEQLAGTNALAGNDYPASLKQPRLALSDDRLTFRAKRTDASVPAQTVDWANVGGGVINFVPSSTSPWIASSIAGSTVQVGVNFAGLEPGFYSGVVQLKAAAKGNKLIGAPSCIRVNLWLLPADTDVPVASPTPSGTPGPTATNTKVPATATPTSTKGTATATSTQVPATATRTRIVATATSTPAPTATSTRLRYHILLPVVLR